MLVHLDALRHLNPLLLRRALPVHLLVDGLQVLDLRFASLHSAVARAQLLLQRRIDCLNINELRRANLAALLQLSTHSGSLALRSLVFRLAVPLSLVLRRDKLLRGGVPQE